jgi:hypothetical protein
VDLLFDAADADASGGIDQEEFDHIMVILCSGIMSRIAVYYGILILLAPHVTSYALQGLDRMGVDDAIDKVDAVWDAHAPSFLQWVVDMVPDSAWQTMPEQFISLLLFFLVVPTLFNLIDETSRSMAERRSTVTTPSETKKDK